jgi:hypothetical protein
MKFLIPLIGLYASISFAQGNKRFICTGSSPFGKNVETVRFTAVVEGLSQISDVTLVTTINHQSYEDHVPKMGGVSDPWELSPQAGTRFYFHSGNTSTFVLIPSADALAKILAASDQDVARGDHGLDFTAEYIFEEYERGLDQDITDLSCVAAVD